MKTKYILPFLWIRDGETDKIADEIKRIAESGISAFCLESRVHWGFCGDTWWPDMDIVMAEAKKRDIQVWLLDDLCYPTGYANGIIEKKFPHLRARHIKAVNVDVVGPVRNAKIPASLNEADGDKLLGAFLFKKKRGGIAFETARDITACVRDGLAFSDIPSGEWRAVFFIETYGGYERPNFIDMLNPASVDCWVDTVYEPHYARYKDEFGKTFAGFFSDEPRFANGVSFADAVSVNAFQNTLGLNGMAYPWSAEVGEALLNGENAAVLAALWYDIGNKTPEIRCRYMKKITDLYGQNFPGRLGRWCAEHGVSYAGHIIEDLGSHARMGCSAGHYFKSQKGADIASVDIVLHQIKPRAALPTVAPQPGGFAHPEFFNYTLAKLASSAAHIDEYKAGRALCEIFGAYGWGESIKDMFWLANHCLSRGVNHFIPHAFSMKAKDTDCPPHFYAQGTNPSFAGYKHLWRHMNEMCAALSGGKQIVSVAVLYHAEAEWSGKKYMPVDNVARVLTQSQIDFDIVPADELEKMSAGSGVLRLGQSEYKAVIVPYGEYLPVETENALQKVSNTVPVFRIGRDIQLNNLARRFWERGIYDARLKKPDKNLRVLHYVKDGADSYFLFNEGTRAVRNAFEGGKQFALEPNEARLVSDILDIPCIRRPKAGGAPVREFDVYLQEAGESEAVFYKRIDGVFDINTEKPYFSGVVTYKAEMKIVEPSSLYLDFDGEFCIIKIGDLSFETVEKKSGHDLSALSPGVYTLEIEINNTLAYRERDQFSGFNYYEGAVLNDVRIRRNEV